MPRQFAVIPELAGCYGPRILVRVSDLDFVDRSILDMLSLWSSSDKREKMISWEFPPEDFIASRGHLLASKYEEVDPEAIWK